MYFHTDDSNLISQLADNLIFAAKHGKRVRIDVDAAGTLKLKIGEGVWSPPFDSTPDPYRDLSQT